MARSVKKGAKAKAGKRAVKDLPAARGRNVKGGSLINEILSNVSKTRSEISMTFARNARA